MHKKNNYQVLIFLCDNIIRFMFSKYRMSYDCSYSVSGRNAGSPRCQTERTMPPVAQKKHQMFAKRYFQEQGTG